MAIHHKNQHYACHCLSYFVKIYRSKNKHISVNFCVICIAQATYTYQALPVVFMGCHYEKVPHTTDCHRPERNLLTAYAAQPMSNLDSGQLRPAVPFRQLAHQT